MTGLTVRYISKNNVPWLSIIVISYPLTANFQGSVDIACSMTVNHVGSTHKCRLDRAKREIIFTVYSKPGKKITNNIAIPQNAEVQLTVKDFRNEAKKLGVSKDKLTLRVYLDNTRVYGIDQIKEGLILYTCEDGKYHSSGLCLPCDPTCKTCTETSDKCTSCPNSDDILDEFKCYTTCA